MLLFFSSDVFHVMNRAARARRHAFQILGMGTKYHFAAQTETECQAWMDAITRVTAGMPETGVECEYTCTLSHSILSHSTLLILSKDEHTLWQECVCVCVCQNL